MTDAATGLPRWALLAIALTTTIALAACSSSSPKPSTSATTPSVTASRTATGPLTSAGLVARLIAGASSLTSARIYLSTKVGTETALTLQADEKLADGKLVAMNLTEQVGAVNLTLLLADGVLYVKLPKSTGTTGKPWARATAHSTNPTLKQLASSLNAIEQSTSLSKYESFVRAASSLKTIGTEQVSGKSATHYSLMIDVTKVDTSAFTPAVKQALVASGLTQVPVDMWVDEQGRPVKVSEKFTVEGQPISADFRLINLNQPVTITAPPPGEVSGS